MPELRHNFYSAWRLAIGDAGSAGGAGLELDGTQQTLDLRARSAAAEKVLLAFDGWHESVGYCQGLNFVVAILLQVLEREEDALLVLCALVAALPSGLYSTHPDELAHCREGMHCKVFALLATALPELVARLRLLGVDAHFFLPRWLSCMFAATLQVPAVLRLVELLLLADGHEARWAERAEGVLIRLAVALMERAAPILCTVPDIPEALQALEHAAASISAEEVTALLMRRWTAARVLRLSQHRQFHLETMGEVGLRLEVPWHHPHEVDEDAPSEEIRTMWSEWVATNLRLELGG